ncbi:IPT/TIG domain-containing protein [Actinoplanes sp. NPDC051859]|uniref:IPT/TIG domain-containing protein n=1 Tax=Actinoplanes sp. NPDC051859 TaxID=3363909 RepID=UPI0037BA9513
MRKSTSTRSRLTRAGIASGVIAAAVLATATPAYAADVEVTLTPSTGPINGGNTIAVAGTGVFTSITAPGARFIPAANSCPAGATQVGAASASSVAATVTKTNDNSGTVVVPTLAIGNWKLCLLSTTATTAVIAGHGATNYVVTTASPVLSPSAGAQNTATVLTATGESGNPYIGSATSVGTTFSLGACPATYTTTGGNMVAGTSTKTSTSVSGITTPANLTAGNKYNVCQYAGTTGTSALIATAVYSVLPDIQLSPAVGPSATAKTISITSTDSFLAGVDTPKVVFVRTACTPLYPTGSPIASSTVNKITDKRMSVLVPVGVTLAGGGEVTAAYNACVYTGTSTTTDSLVAVPATYTVAGATTVSSIAPTAGPAQGGSLVTITGTGFPTGAGAVVSASVGGSPLQDVKVVSATKITGITTAHAPGAASVSVTTAAGTENAAGTPYSYTYGLTVAPNTAKPNSQPWLSIQGTGFTGTTWGSAVNDDDSHVFLVKDAYDPTDDTQTGEWDVPPVTQCTNVTLISDVEIVCRLDLTQTVDPDGTILAADPTIGTYTVMVVNDGEPGATVVAGTDTSVVSSGSTFTVAPF